MVRNDIFRCIYILMFVFIAFPVPVRAAGGSVFMKPYIDALSQLGTKCHIDYWSILETQNGAKSETLGSMAVANESYFDSSNSRFVLKNDKWCIVANHDDKILSVINLDDWQKKMGKEYHLDFSGFLIMDNDLSKLNDLKAELVADSTKVTVLKNVSNEETISLTLWYAKGSFVPARYEGVITYYAPGNDNQSAMQAMSVAATVRFRCWHIRQNPDKLLFDERRIINQTGPRQAYMKRFNNYKMHRAGR